MTAALAAAVLFWRKAKDSLAKEQLFTGEIEINGEALSETTRLTAFLFMVAAAETGLDKARSGESYATFYGNSIFRDFSNHPVLTGEKTGVKLSDKMCKNAGFGPGCVSTAAGAYQINLPTWLEVSRAGAWGSELIDFTPESQDEAARRILILTGALPLLESGDFDGALNAASARWASLPGSNAQQNPKAYAAVANYFFEGIA